MSRLIDVDHLSKRDLKLIHDTLAMLLRLTEGGVQLDLLLAEPSTDDRAFDRGELLPDDFSLPDGLSLPKGIRRRWLTVAEAAPILGRPEAYIRNNWARLRLARKVQGRVYIDAIRLPSLTALLKQLFPISNEGNAGI